MLLSHLNYANMEIYTNLKFVTNLLKMLRLDKMNKTLQEFLQFFYTSLRILTNFLRALRFLYKQLTKYLANLLRMLQILKNAVTNLKNACERITNETTTQRVFANFVSLSLIRQHISCHIVIFCISLKKTSIFSQIFADLLSILFNNFFKRFLFATVYTNQLHKFGSLNRQIKLQFKNN